MNINQLCNEISDSVTKENGLSNDELVQLIEHAGGYLNLQTIPDYAKSHGKSYNVKNFRKVRSIFNVKFIIDNE